MLGQSKHTNATQDIAGMKRQYTKVNGFYFDRCMLVETVSGKPFQNKESFGSRAVTGESSHNPPSPTIPATAKAHI